MLSALFRRAGGLAVFLMAVSARADRWNYWGQVSIPNMQFGTQSAQLATDGTNLFYSTLIDGVYRAALADQNFSPMPLTGFPIWDANTNTNGFAIGNLAVAPHGTLLLSGSPVNINSNTISPPPSSFTNPLPVFYWWDETNQTWRAAAVTNKTYPYTGNVGNFSIAPDGSVWTCSGYASYVYRSTDDGHSYAAFDINARVPANYFPLPFNTSLMTVGKVFSIVAGPNNQVVIGTEAGGFLHTTNNGLTWTSLDPNFTNPNSVNPLGRIGDAQITGLDRGGNFFCANFQMSQSPGYANWSGVKLIGWHPADGSYYNAANGFLGGFGPARVFTPPSGVTFTFMNQNYLLQGGIFRSPDGKNWTQFNQGSGLDFPFAAGITNALGPGNCITTLGNVIYVGVGNALFSYDSTPPPITNRPPVALAQNINLWENTPTNFTLAGYDADGDALSFTILTPPQFGSLTGTPPDVTYTPSNNVTSTDRLLFLVDDGMATSAPVVVNFSVNSPANTPPIIAFSSPVNQSWRVAPTNLVFSATASDFNSIQQVDFFNGTNFLAFVVNPPYMFTWTNPAPGDYTLNALAVSKSEARAWAQPVTVSILPAAPILTIQQADAIDVSVTWPLALDGFYVESATGADGPWTLSPFPPLYFANGQTATIPMADQQFFRLMRPQ